MIRLDACCVCLYLLRYVSGDLDRPPQNGIPMLPSDRQATRASALLALLRRTRFMSMIDTEMP